MATRPGHIEITNEKRDTKHFRTVWKTEDGKRPTEGDAPESFTLSLGSQDDDNDDARSTDPVTLQPMQEVPVWAANLYRKIPVFAAHVEKRHISLGRSA